MQRCIALAPLGRAGRRWMMVRIAVQPCVDAGGGYPLHFLLGIRQRQLLPASDHPAAACATAELPRLGILQEQRCILLRVRTACATECA